MLAGRTACTVTYAAKAWQQEQGRYTPLLLPERLYVWAWLHLYAVTTPIQQSTYLAYIVLSFTQLFLALTAPYWCWVGLTYVFSVVCLRMPSCDMHTSVIVYLCLLCVSVLPPYCVSVLLRLQRPTAEVWRHLTCYMKAADGTSVRVCYTACWVCCGCFDQRSPFPACEPV